MKNRALRNEFLHYVILNVCGMIGLSCYILADTFFVANGLGADGLTALNLAIPVYSFVHGSGLMLGMGGAIRYSVLKSHGEDGGSANRQEGAQTDLVFTNTVCLAALIALICLAAGLLLPGQLASALGARGAVHGMTTIYLRVILLFSPAFLLNDVLICFVRNDGNPRLSMAAMLAGSMANIVMDYIFIFPLGMGIFGAVLATGFAPVIGMCVLSGHWFSGKVGFHLVRGRKMFKYTINIESLGIPSLVTEVASGIVMIVFNFLILNLNGNTGVAAYGIIANLSLVVTAIYTGIAQGMQPVLSRSYGYGNRKEVKQVLRYAMSVMLLISAAVYLAFLLWADPITGAFNREGDPVLAQIATAGLRLYFIAIPFAGGNIVLAAYFTSIERALPAQVISLSRGFFVILPAAGLMAYAFGLTGVWLSWPLAEGLVAVMGAALYAGKRVAAFDKRDSVG